MAWLQHCGVDVENRIKVLVHLVVGHVVTFVEIQHHALRLVCIQQRLLFDKHVLPASPAHCPQVLGCIGGEHLLNLIPGVDIGPQPCSHGNVDPEVGSAAGTQGTFGIVVVLAAGQCKKCVPGSKRGICIRGGMIPQDLLNKDARNGRCNDGRAPIHSEKADWDVIAVDVLDVRAILLPYCLRQTVPDNWCWCPTQQTKNQE
mmetsp:Transcript_58671/g.137283  ORF Transcript_58671/g.137283 Transcript_58671/m.137283 type:complete len:202 (-) Transcript_58671:102-707(-)